MMKNKNNLIILDKKVIEEKIKLADKEYASLSWVSRSGDIGKELEKKFKILVESLLNSKEVEVMDIYNEYASFLRGEDKKYGQEFQDYIANKGYQLIKIKE